MTVVVRQSSSNSIAVTQGSQTQAAITVKKGTDLTVQGLSNVVSTDLQDGYTLVYDTTTNKWVTQQLGIESITGIDGGTY